jgi:hypothetical protein
LNAVVPRIGYVYISRRAYGDAMGVMEFGVTRTFGTPLSQKRTSRRKILYAVISAIGYIYTPVRSGCEIRKPLETAVNGTT